MIDTQAIRKKILDLALRGKLTKQLPEDGTGQQLFQHIQERKAVLAGAGKTKKQEPLLPLSEEDIPFEIPDNWQWVRLGDITAKITSGSTPTGGKKSDAYVDKGFCFFREQNIYNDGIHSEGMVYITEQLLNTRENSTVIAKDILLNITGGSIGRCAIVPDDFSKGSVNQHILIIRMVEEETRFFTHQVLCSPYAQNHIKSKAVGDKDGFSGGRCKYMPVPLPPLPVQKRIVSIIHSAFSVLDTIDTLQSQYQDNLVTLKSKIIDAGIQGKLTKQLSEDGTAEELYQQIQQEKAALEKAGKIKKSKPLPPISDEEKPFDIPENWKWVRFDVISNILGTGMIRAGNEQFNEAEYYYFKMNNIGNFDGKCHFENLVMVNASKEEFDRYKLEEDDFLFNTRNSKELVGKTAVVPPISQPIILNNNILKIHFLGGIVPKYINYYFLSMQGHTRLSSFVTSTTNVAAIYQRQLITFCVPLPPLAEQKRIVAKLEELLPLCEG